MSDPRDLSLSELAAAYREHSFFPTEVTEAYLQAIEPGEVYRVVTAERAREQAERAEKLFKRGVVLGPLQGVPVALKDLIDTEGVVTAAGSKVLADGDAAPEDAPVAARLDAAGAVFLGKTTMTELAFSGIGINPHFGTPPCAFDDARVPGGSSSGSAVAVAKRLACAAVGSDTGGSVRIPSAFNGLVGLKTSDGALPIDGCVPLSTTLDTLGPMTCTVEDAWHLWRALAAKPAAPFDPQLPDTLELLVPETLIFDEADPDVLTAFERAVAGLESQGHKIERRAVPEFSAITELYARYGSFASHEALALYEEMLETRGDEVDLRVAKRILQFRGRPASDYLRLGYARRDLVRAFWQTYRAYDAVLAPTVAILPPKMKDLVEDEAYFRANGLCLRNTMLFNFLAGPAASVPCGTSADGLPVGLMIATPPQRETLALGIAALLEQRH